MSCFVDYKEELEDVQKGASQKRERTFTWHIYLFSYIYNVDINAKNTLYIFFFYKKCFFI